MGGDRSPTSLLLLLLLVALLLISACPTVQSFEIQVSIDGRLQIINIRIGDNVTEIAASFCGEHMAKEGQHLEHCVSLLQKHIIREQQQQDYHHGSGTGRGRDAAREEERRFFTGKGHYESIRSMREVAESLGYVSAREDEVSMTEPVHLWLPHSRDLIDWNLFREGKDIAGQIPALIDVQNKDFQILALKNYTKTRQAQEEVDQHEHGIAKAISWRGEMFPVTYVLSDPEDCAALLWESEQNSEVEDVVWLFKIASGWFGNGMRFFTSFPTLRAGWMVRDTTGKSFASACRRLSAELGGAGTAISRHQRHE